MDFNTIIAAAFNTAVEQATRPMLERIAALESKAFAVERIENVEAAVGNVALATVPAVRIDALYTLLGALIDTSDEGIEEVKAGGLPLSKRLDAFIKAAAESASEESMEMHNYNYDHDDFYSGPDSVFDDIETKIGDLIDEKLESGPLSDLADRVREVIRNDITFEVSVS